MIAFGPPDTWTIEPTRTQLWLTALQAALVVVLLVVLAACDRDAAATPPSPARQARAGLDAGPPPMPVPEPTPPVDGGPLAPAPR